MNVYVIGNNSKRCYPKSPTIGYGNYVDLNKVACIYSLNLNEIDLIMNIYFFVEQLYF